MSQLRNFIKFTLTKDGRSVWLVAAFNALMILWVYLLSGQTYARFFLSIVYVLFLPGYSLVELISTFEKNVEGVEKIAYSFGLSMVTVILLSFLLNYTPWGISLVPLLVGISVFTIVCISLAVVRKYRNRPQQA